MIIGHTSAKIKKKKIRKNTFKNIEFKKFFL